MVSRALAITVMLVITLPIISGTAVAKQQSQEITKQLLIVYIGAWSCEPCKTDEMKQAINRMFDIVAERALTENRVPRKLGAATDPEVADGLRFLSDYDFDELIVGGGWANMAALNYISGNPDAVSGVPQVFVIKRDLAIKHGKVVVLNERVVATALGTGILLWVADGATISE